MSEAPRGTLLHHYKVDDDGIVQWANLVIATGHNNLAMNQGVHQVAKRYVKSAKLEEPMLNRVEAVIRCFDPCLSCSTHALGEMPLQLQLLGPDGAVLDELHAVTAKRRFAADRFARHRLRQPAPQRRRRRLARRRSAWPPTRGWPASTILQRHQLTPELALDVSRADLVVLVDARVRAAGRHGVGRARRRRRPPTRTTWSHHLGPASLVALARELYGRCGRRPRRQRRGRVARGRRARCRRRSRARPAGRVEAVGRGRWPARAPRRGSCRSPGGRRRA